MTILVAIGEEHQSNPVVETAYDLARAYDEPLNVLHVIPSAEFNEHKQAIEGDLSGFDDYSLAQEEESAAEFAERVVDETLDGARVELSGIGRVGDPVEMVLSVVEEITPQYLVIGGRRRSPAGKAIFGNKTQSILLEADVPVVTVMLNE